MGLYIPAQLLAKLWPHAPAALVSGISASSAEGFQHYGLTTLAEVQTFMAECSEETGGGIALRESGAYSAERAHEVWPSLFPTVQSAQVIVGNPKLLFDKTYGGRLGNRVDTDDGYNFRGGGLIQLTGRTWYAEVGKEAGIDLLEHPDMVVDPEYALECALAFWKIDGVNKTVGNLKAEVKLINGGYVNMAAREAWEAIWQKNLTLEVATFRPTPVVAVGPAPVEVPKEPIIVKPVAGGAPILHPGFMEELALLFHRWL